MAREITQIRQHVARDHPQLAEVIGKEGLDELLNLLEEIADAKIEEFGRDMGRQGDRSRKN